MQAAQAKYSSAYHKGKNATSCTELSFLLNNCIRKESLDAEKEKKEREGTS